jgi:hypothetical protein
MAPIDWRRTTWSTDYHLGTPGSPHQFLVTLRKPRKLLCSNSSPNLRLHSGPSPRHTELASISRRSTFSPDYIVHVPVYGTEVLFQTNCSSSSSSNPQKTVVHRFSMDLGRGGLGHTEDFEWRLCPWGTPAEGQYGDHGFELRRTTPGFDDDLVGALGMGTAPDGSRRTYSFVLLGQSLDGSFGPAFDLVALVTAARTYQLEAERLGRGAAVASFGTNF